MEKIDDLENRSRTNNFRVIGLPESYKTDSYRSQFLACYRGLSALWWNKHTALALRLTPAPNRGQSSPVF